MTSFDLGMAAIIKDVLSEDAFYYGSQLYYQTPVGPRPRPAHTVSNQGTGNNASHALPSQDCGLVSLYTDILGKTGQGRIYTPFPPVDALETDGTVTVAFQGILDDVGAYMITPRVVTDGGITATFNACLYTPGGDPPKLFTSYIVRGAFATQRKRGAFGRLNQRPF